MPGWAVRYTQDSQAATNLANGVETVVATLTGVSNGGPGTKVDLSGFLNVLTGAASTTVTLRIRRGIDTTGVLVGQPAPTPAAAAVSTDANIACTDLPAGELANQSYVLTAVVAGGAAAGTAQGAHIEASRV